MIKVRNVKQKQRIAMKKDNSPQFEDRKTNYANESRFYKGKNIDFVV